MLVQTVTEKTGTGISAIKSELIEQLRQNFRKMIFNLWNNFWEKNGAYTSNGIHLTGNYFLPVISHETILKENCKI
jgi:hypothetical protein